MFKIVVLNSIILSRQPKCWEEYTREFEKLVIKRDLQELEEQTIARHLGRLDPRYDNMVDLQAYITFDEVCVLAYKVEQQKKSRQPPEPQNPKPFTWNQPFNKGSSNPISKPRNPFSSFPKRILAPQKNQAPQNRPNPNLMSKKRCFTCQGLGHIASDYANHKAITLAEWSAMKEVFKDEEKKKDCEDELKET